MGKRVQRTPKIRRQLFAAVQSVIEIGFFASAFRQSQLRACHAEDRAEERAGQRDVLVGVVNYLEQA